MYDLFKVILE